jgi:hypothetical protein
MTFKNYPAKDPKIIHIKLAQMEANFQTIKIM